MKMYKVTRLCVVTATLGLLVGCAQSTATESKNQESAQTSISAGKYFLAEEPEGAVAVSEAKQLLTDKSGPQEIVLLGRIGAGDDSVWDSGRAVFLLSDAAAMFETHDHHHGKGHDPSTCPFCKKNKSLNDIAIVKFLDERGEVVAADARKLLGVKENQLVVVRGTGKIDSLGNVVIAATGIYVRE